MRLAKQPGSARALLALCKLYCEVEVVSHGSGTNCGMMVTVCQTDEELFFCSQHGTLDSSLVGPSEFYP